MVLMVNCTEYMEQPRNNTVFTIIGSGELNDVPDNSYISSASRISGKQA